MHIPTSLIPTILARVDLTVSQSRALAQYIDKTGFIEIEQDKGHVNNLHACTEFTASQIVAISFLDALASPEPAIYILTRKQFYALFEKHKRFHIPWHMGNDRFKHYYAWAYGGYHYILTDDYTEYIIHDNSLDITMFCETIEEEPPVSEEWKNNEYATAIRPILI